MAEIIFDESLELCVGDGVLLNAGSKTTSLAYGGNLLSIRLAVLMFSTISKINWCLLHSM